MSPDEQGQWENPSDPVRNKSMPKDHPRAAPGDPQPHRLAGANTQWVNGRGSAHRLRSHCFGGMGHIMGCRQMNIWGFHKAYYGMFRKGTSVRERSLSGWFREEQAQENSGIRGSKSVSKLLTSSSCVCVLMGARDSTSMTVTLGDHLSVCPSS